MGDYEAFADQFAADFPDIAERLNQEPAFIVFRLRKV